jgi:hypothetical protein
MAKTLVALVLVVVATPVFAAEESVSSDALQPRVIHIDANTQIRVDPRLRSVTGTDTAAAGASASMEERHRADMKSGAAGPDEDTVKSTLPSTLRGKDGKARQPRR